MLGCIGIILGTVLALLALLHFLYPPIWRDLYTIWVSTGVIRKVKKACAEKELVIDQFEKQALSRPEHPFIIYKDETFTYDFVEKQATKVARAFQEIKIGQGDTIALVMSNEPAFVWIYLGSQKIGVRIALVNHHLKSDALYHSIKSCVPKLVLVGDGIDDYLPQCVQQLEPSLDVPVYSYNKPKKDVPFPSFSDVMDSVPSFPLGSSERSGVKLSDPCAFIYTSGTTGFPKPAIISHKKAILCSYCFGPVGFKPSDVMYLSLPLYHASALNLALLNVINVGATMVLREKFSASNFWSDCCKHNVTCVQYIGEMLRYLVNTPARPDDTNHRVWAAIGNGLRADIWMAFKSRFKVRQIYEFYGSTEVPASVTNYFNVPGSVGRLSPLLSRLMSLILVKVDPVTYEPFRNSEGRCEAIKPGSSGVLLAKLSEKLTFEGYLGPAKDTMSRIIKDVFEEGDFYVNTNDIFTLDQEYNMYFKDRTGDTFRWKGENVSSAEVSSAMNSINFVQDTNVFGVEVPGCEGKAGMAAVNLKDNEELDNDKVQELGHLCREKLPGYARPRFLRFQRQMSLTSTFKQQKRDLYMEGYNPAVVDEPLYYLDRSTDEFKPLDCKTYQGIVDGNVRL